MFEFFVLWLAENIVDYRDSPIRLLLLLIPAFPLERAAVLSDSYIVVAEKIPQLKTLSAEEKLILVGELWDQLAADPQSFPEREDHVRLLEERLAHYRKHPDDVIAWEEVKKRILSSR